MPTVIMGSLCGKESAPSGRVLGSTPSPSRASLLPGFISKKPRVGGPGKTLGTSNSGYGEIDGANGEQSAPVNARVAAALAAEKRSNTATQKSGKLAAQLEQQKRKTQNQHIQEQAKGNGQREQLVWD